MERKHMNRQATRRISISVTVCLSLLASCVAKPVEQDLASGDATVEIKYLDSVTMDIIDDTRTRRRKFYETALNDPDKKYSQGKQGAIDRESTFAAAINANAQRDKSVLERYSAEGSRQLSALENSEELGDETLEHNKKLISQTNDLNDAKVKAVESQAETLAELNKAKVEAANTLVKEYQAELERISGEMEELEKTLAGYKEDLKAATDAEKAELQKKITAIEGADGTRGSGSRFKTLQDKKEATAGTLNKLFTDADGGIISNAGLLGSDMELNDKKFGSYPLDSQGYTTYTWKKPTADAEETWVPDKKYEFNPSQLPQAEKPKDAAYLSSALKGLDDIKSKMDSLASANTDEAIRKTRELAAPPIERVRNDEAVLDYLLDGYRNTQISSGAEYGGMVRRVLPFSFTFTPGSSTNSGFSARVLLRPDKQQIHEAANLLAPHLNAMAQDRIRGYMQDYKLAGYKLDKQGETLTGKLLLESSCGAEENITTFDLNLFNLDSSKHINGDNEKNAFWKAYSVSTEALNQALTDAIDKKIYNLKYGTDLYQYDFSAILKSIAEKVEKIRLKRREESSSIYSFSPQNFSDHQKMAVTYICRMNKMMGGVLHKINERSDIYETDKAKNIFAELDQLAMAMTSAGLMHDLYMQANPIFDKKAKVTIKIMPDGVRYKTVKVDEKNKQVHVGSYYKSVMEAASVNIAEIEKRALNSATPKIVQNTSREQVVEIPDTAKINTFLSAAMTGNDVSQQLGLTMGAELAAAVSSSSAFIKRIPYAAPFTGQSFSSASAQKKACNENEELAQCGDDSTAKGRSCVCDYENQSFGWRFYKTPAGVTQLGDIVQSFKTTPVNSAVVVSMPEWISKLEATYEIFEDSGKTWRTVGGEKITLAGASLRGPLSSDSASSFETWVKYHLYREVDGNVGMPKLKSCYSQADGIIYGSSSGYTALCGENLYGVKGVLIGGRYVDDIEKVSSSLIKVKIPNLAKQDCVSNENCKNDGSECSPKCRVVLLSDFGAHDSDVWLDFTFSDSKSNDEHVNLLEELGKPTVEYSTGTDKGKIKITFENKAILASYVLPRRNEKTVSSGAEEITLTKEELVEGYCKDIDRYSCQIPIKGSVKIGGFVNRGMLYTIDIPSLQIPFVDDEKIKCDETPKKCLVVINNYRKNDFFMPERIRFEQSDWLKEIDASLQENNNSLSISILEERIKTNCGKEKGKCKVYIKYHGYKKEYYIGEIDV